MATTATSHRPALVGAEVPWYAIVRHTSDTTLLAVFEPWQRNVDGIPLADPDQQIRDLHELGGADRVEAADRLTAAVLDGKLAVES